MLIKLLCIGIGGFIGAIARFSVISLASHLYHKHPLPLGTITVNLLGSLIIGILYGLSNNWNISENLKSLLAIGFLGAFTTFSTFSFETFILIEKKHLLLATFNISIQVITGIIAVYLGIILTKNLFQ